jgi:Zn finger protein HypA/HybF involved in hydrogenase expression
MAHAYDEDVYTAALAAEEDSVNRAEAESFAHEHDAEIIQLTSRCQLCGYRCSPQTWDGFLSACPNCGNQRGRM